MNSSNQRKLTRVVCLVLAAVLLLSLVSTALIMLVSAASSAEIKTELTALRAKQAEIQKQSDALEKRIAENKTKTQTLVGQKADIDQQMEMSRQKIENLNAQIQQYNLLIAEKQNELDEAVARENALNTQYKARLRSMEETGSVSYWSILFKASSFSDLLDRVDMIHEIAKSDQLMMKKLSEATEAVQQSREELEQEQQQMQTARDELAAQEAQLEMQRAEADALLLQIAEECEKMTAEYQGYLAQEDALSKQVAKAEKDYYQALAKEEAARLAELNKQNNYVPANKDSSGFLYPLPCV